MIEKTMPMEQQILLITPQSETLAPLVAVMRTILQQIPTLVKPYESLSVIEKGSYDLIIFDMQGTYEDVPLIRNLKQSFPLIPVVAMVPYGDVRMVEKALEQGADDYISQPISLERLKTTLRNALRVRKLLQAASAGPISMQALNGVGVPGMALLTDPKGELKTLRAIEDMVIQHAISACDGCITQAAQALGIGRSTLYRKMQERMQSAGNSQSTPGALQASGKGG
ncbi:MAG: helix-turn-helix domain-containing protein [Alphaproteobacteria bacterium]|nr:helix-turn-helix domain-containing protein [Alphaproteobacteria bacterium]